MGKSSPIDRFEFETFISVRSSEIFGTTHNDKISGWDGVAVTDGVKHISNSSPAGSVTLQLGVGNVDALAERELVFDGVLHSLNKSPSAIVIEVVDDGVGVATTTIGVDVGVAQGTPGVMCHSLVSPSCS